MKSIAKSGLLRIRTLDGWRGLAIVLVTAQHAAIWSRFRYRIWANLGSLGVDIFFVVSGYIITLRLLEEMERTSTIDLRSFYCRRAFRILPLVCAYLLTLTILSASITLPGFHTSEILGSLFFFRNYQVAATGDGFYTMHFWSLAVEEHFYLLWPALLLWLGKRRGLWFALVGAAACGLWRFIDCGHPNNWIGRILPGQEPWLRQVRTDARFDGLLLGCAVAMLLVRPAVRAFILRNFPKETPLLLALLLLLNFKRANGTATLTSYILVSLILASTLVVEEGLAHKWINAPLLVWFGTVSFSAYIWQKLFLTHPGPFGAHLDKLGLFPLNVICVLSISALSYYFIEKPCIAQGRHLLAQRSERTVMMAAD